MNAPPSLYLLYSQPCISAYKKRIVSYSFFTLPAYRPWHSDPIPSSSAKFTHCITSSPIKQEKYMIIKINIIQQQLKYNTLI
jgi:hypothetical protein